MYDTKGAKVRKGIMRTKTKLTLEQTQQGVSDEVLVKPVVAAAGPRQVRFIATCSYSTDISKDIMKAQNFKKDDYTSFQDQEKYEHVGLKVTSTQDGKRSQDDDKILYSADDLKNLKDHMQVKHKGTSSSLKSKDHYAYQNDLPYGEIVRNREKTRSLLKYVARRTSSVSSNNPVLSFLKRFNGIKFIHDPKSPKVSKGLESPSLQGCRRLEYELELQEP
ncbi:hypothetical protein Tco_0964026, partial [Tanacetum coccineum]